MLIQMFGENLCDLVAGKMNNRSGIMGSSSSRKLIDPVADIRLNDLDAMAGQKRGEACFSGDVRLRFDDEPFLTDLLQENFTGLSRIPCLNHPELVLLKRRDCFLQEVPVSHRLRADSLHLFLGLLKVIERGKILLLTVSILSESAPLVF